MIFETALFLSLLVGQLGRIQITSDIAFYIHDLVIFCYLLFRFKWVKGTLSGALLLVVGVCAFSLIANIRGVHYSDIIVGALYLLRFCMYVSVYFAILQSARNRLFWFSWLYALGVGYAVVGFVQLLVYPNLRNIAYLGWDPHNLRLFSTLFDPNFVGCVFVLSLFLGLYLVTRGILKPFIIISQMLLFCALVLTYSRSSVVALIAGLMTYVVVTRKWKYAVAIVLVVLSILAFPSLGGISTDIGRMWSVTARVSNWQEGSQLFLESPIVGHGFNMLRSIPRLGTTSPYGYALHAAGGIDNSILFILVTTGIIGFVAFGYVGVCLVKLGMTFSETIKKGSYFSILIALAVHSLFVNSLFYPQILLWFWIFVGAVAKKDAISRS